MSAEYHAGRDLSPRRRAAETISRPSASCPPALDTTDFKIGMLHKQKLYQQQGKRLLSLCPVDLPHLDAKLGAALALRLP